MASLLNPPLGFPHKKVNSRISGPLLAITLSNRAFLPLPRTGGYFGQNIEIKAKSSTRADGSAKASVGVEVDSDESDFGVVTVNHVALLCESLERSLNFYHNVLGLKINDARHELPYRGAWLWVGSEMIHLKELPNPDPVTGRPEHAGRDRHTCIAIRDVSKLKTILEKAGIPYTLSKSGRPAIFTHDPDGNGLEFTQV